MNINKSQSIRAVLMVFVIGVSAIAGTGAVSASSTDYTPISDSDADIIVDKSGDTGSYTSLQEAVNNASAGDTIKVKSGTYADGDSTNSAYVAVIDKQVNIHFADGAVVDGSTQTNGLQVTADGVVVKGVDFGSNFGSSSTLTMVDDVSGADITDYTQTHAKYNGDITTVSATVHLNDSDGDGANITVHATHNYWGTIDRNTISTSTVISNSSGIQGDVEYEPFYMTSSMDQLSTNGLVDVTVNVVDKDGNAVTSGTVILTDSAGNQIGSKTVDSNGTVSFTDVEDGDVTVDIESADYKNVSETVTIEQDTVLEGTLYTSSSDSSSTITVESGGATGGAFFGDGGSLGLGAIVLIGGGAYVLFYRDED
ncbi:hypothetical protein G3I44_13610 [Halogeometricum borinquense]|uniref:Uncharacterized protein n=1 Tax=Halogeometricum borinquense TaxID=60847 RepID=A0A6C0UJ57_9EURY|nr:carboxypeptidase-like regulatory domain-containing protein [Halogeometricum borinquense]QIB75230.1 hypothetical protein G3I44_13610 [Halogeometricum borinquense]